MVKINYDELLKVKIRRNSKIPSEGWKNSKIKEVKNNYNVGIKTGEENNLIVVDVDFKDEGIEEMDIYIREYGEPQTVKQRSIRGGYHLFFQYNHSDDECKYLIENYLKNAAGYRGKGIDVRTTGGYIMSYPSIINNKQYIYERSFENYEVMEIPRSLLLFLLIEKTEDIKSKEKVTKKVVESSIKKENELKEKYTYLITKEEIEYILNKLDDSFNNDYHKWLIVTTVLKTHDQYDLWIEFSKKSEKYYKNQKQNDIIWNGIKSMIDINYLIYLLNKDKKNMNYVTKIKNYCPLMYYKYITNKDYDFKKIDIDNKYLSDKISYNQMMSYDTIIIKSDPGTGKTFMFSKYLKQYIENTDYKIISLISRRSLGYQHITNFNKDGINLVSYESEAKDIYKDNIVCCINSILIFEELTEEELRDKIIFIDEINSFLEHLTHNKTLDHILKKVFLILSKMIKYCHKLIVCDALIADSTLIFLNDKKNKLFIENSYKNFKNTKAIRINDEQDFFNIAIEKCKRGEYFLCACDCAEKITSLRNECLKVVKNPDDIILITGDEKRIIIDASKEFYGKFVFYSPSITTGIDFSIPEAQDVLIYITGCSILASSIWQQTSRTRNMKTLYFYSIAKEKKIKYDTIEDVIKYNKDLSTMNEKILNICVNVNEEEEIKIINNKFYNLFIYNEYVRDIFDSNPTYQYVEILKKNGFDIKMKKDELNIELEYEKKKEMKEEILIEKKRKFNEYINYIKTDNEKQFNIIYEDFNKNIKYFNLQNEDKDTLKKYMDEIIDNYKREDHCNFINLIKNEKYIDEKIKEESEKSMELRKNRSIYKKIKAVKTIEKRYGIYFYNESINEIKKDDIKMDDEYYGYLKLLFRTEKKKPENFDQLKKLYVSMLRNITNVSFIDSVKNKTKINRNCHKYVLNRLIIKNNINLDKCRNKELLNYEEAIKDFFLECK
jgi:hypothetical protein